MKEFFIQVPGTILPLGSYYAAGVASNTHPDLFTGKTDLKLRRLDEVQKECEAKKTPVIGETFKRLYEDIPAEQRFYMQWSGNLWAPMEKKTPWDEGGEHLAKKMRELVGDSRDPVLFRFVGHSHGLQLIRIAAEILKQTHPHIQFEVTSVSSPMCINPPIVMPDNVRFWQHFYYPDKGGKTDFGDATAYFGSWQMQGICSRTPVKRRIEDVLKEMGASAPSLEGKAWQSHDLRSILSKPLASPHEDSMRGEAAKFICDTVLKKLEEIKEERPAKRRRINQ